MIRRFLQENGRPEFQLEAALPQVQAELGGVVRLRPGSMETPFRTLRQGSALHARKVLSYV